MRDMAQFAIYGLVTLLFTNYLARRNKRNSLRDTLQRWALQRLPLRLILMPFNLTFAACEHFHRIETESARKVWQDDTGITKVETVDSALGIARMNAHKAQCVVQRDSRKLFRMPS